LDAYTGVCTHVGITIRHKYDVDTLAISEYLAFIDSHK